MASADIDPDEISCCSAISACEAGAWQCALQILDDMLAAVILPNDSRQTFRRGDW